MRSLTVHSLSGLCNRLRVLTSGLAIAEATGRRFRMLWPINPECDVAFHDLFVNDWPVEMADLSVLNDPHRLIVRRFIGWRKMPNVADMEADDLVVSTGSWLFASRNQQNHQILHTDFWNHLELASEDPHLVALIGRTVDLIRDLRPVPQIQSAVDAFRAEYFRPRMIGLHLRRGDFVDRRPHVSGNTAQVMAEVDRILAVEPDAGILLCSDDGAPDVQTGTETKVEGVHTKFWTRYGERVVWTTSEHIRSGFIRDGRHALLDLWLLRSTDYFIGTSSSSFSQLAHVTGDIPAVLVSGGTLKHRRRERILYWTGSSAILQMLARRYLEPYVQSHEMVPLLWQKLKRRLGRS
ncbi:MAG: hypothetical protein NTZ50_03165 [Chloroflexi bacterium]|nr:hypothetical protein [Chloroflexota bacterium]